MVKRCSIENTATNKRVLCHGLLGKEDVSRPVMDIGGKNTGIIVKGAVFLHSYYKATLTVFGYLCI